VRTGQRRAQTGREASWAAIAYSARWERDLSGCALGPMLLYDDSLKTKEFNTTGIPTLFRNPE